MVLCVRGRNVNPLFTLFARIFPCPSPCPPPPQAGEIHNFCHPNSLLTLQVRRGGRGLGRSGARARAGAI